MSHLYFNTGKHAPSDWFGSWKCGKRIVVSIFLYVAASLNGFAQHIHVSGTLLSEKEKQPVEYATIVIYQSADSAYMAGGVSDSTGCFKIEVPSGDYFLEVNHINYKRFYEPVGGITSDTRFAPFYLSRYMQSIGEVVITGQTPSVRMTNEKSIYKVSDIPASASGSLHDIFKVLPSLTLDFNDRVLINGAPVRFFVNDREVSGEELKAYSPAQIATIEIISNPTAQYDAQGLSGIVMLRTKSGGTAGISGSANLSGAHDMQTGAANLSYSRNRLSLASAFSLWNNYQHGAIETNTTDHHSVNNVRATVTNIMANASADYKYNDNNTLSASYQYIDFGYTAKDYSPMRTGKSDMRGITHQFAMDYAHQFAREKEWFKASFYYNETSPETVSRLHYIDGDFDVQNLNYNNSLVGLFSYYLPFTENANLEAGVKSHTRNITINRTDNFSGSPVSDKFRMRESILAAYVQMNSRMENFNVQFGLRSETNLADKADGSRKWDIFPNLSLDYSVDEENTLKLGYTNRVNRPSAADINPFTLLVDPTSTFRGNPDLKPEYSHAIFIDYMNRYQSGNNKLSAYCRIARDLITKTFASTDDGILYVPVNLPSASFYGMDFASTRSLGNVLSVRPSAGCSFVHIPRGTDKQYRNLFSFDLGMSVEIKLPKNLNMQVVGRYSSGTLSLGSSSQSAIVQGLAIGLPQFITEISVSKSLLKENLVLSLRMTDPFRLQQKGFKSYSAGLLRESIYRMETRFVYLSLSYRFNNFKSRARKYDDGGIHVF